MKLEQYRLPTLVLSFAILLVSMWLSGCSAATPTTMTTPIALGETPVQRIQLRAYAEGINVGPLYNDHSSGISTMVLVVRVPPETSESAYEEIAGKLHALANAYGGDALNAVRLEVRFVSATDPNKVLVRRYYPLSLAARGRRQANPRRNERCGIRQHGGSRDGQS